MLPASDHFVRVAYAEIGENALEKIGFHKASSQRIDSFPLMLHNGTDEGKRQQEYNR